MKAEAPPEIPNPYRGQYLWHQAGPDPEGWPVVDSYARYPWRELEGDTQGSFDFSAIERELDAARGRRGRFGFRVMLLDTSEGGSQLPAYLARDGNAWWCAAEAGSPPSLMPDWNNELLLARWEALMKALGDRFRDQPAAGVIDIGGYGNWGEWHDFPYRSRYPGPNGQVPGTDASVKRFIDAVHLNFPNNYLAMGADHAHGLRYALGLSPRIGPRVDCIGGDPDMMGGRSGLEAVPESLERWKTAPFVTEWCGNIVPGSNLFRDLGLPQVREFHVAMLSSGNYHKPWTAFSQAEQGAFVAANLVSGYRIVLREVTLPRTVEAGAIFDVTSQWENVNVTPPYGVWNVVFQLRSPGSASAAWSGRSRLDLRTLLPTGPAPAKVVDSFRLPADLSPGTYDVRVAVTDPTGATEPMRLAIAGRDRDGAYTIGAAGVVSRPGTGVVVAQPGSGPAWAFAVISDAWGGLTDGVVQGLSSACTAHPEIRFIVGTGDLKDLDLLEKGIQRELKRHFPGQKLVPWFTVLGNHNVEDRADTDFIVDTLGARLGNQLPGLKNLRMGPADPAQHWSRQTTSYSFDYENAHLVMLNQYLGSNAGHPRHPLACPWEALVSWLKADLAATAQPIIFVFGHEPAFVHESGPAHCGDSLDDPACPGNTAPPPDEWKQIRPARDRFWRLLRDQRVVAHVDGHTHESSVRVVRGFSDFDTASCINREWNCYCLVEKRTPQVADGATIGPTDGVVEFNAGLSLAQGPVNVIQVRGGLVNFRIYDRDRTSGRLTSRRSFQYLANPDPAARARTPPTER